MNLNKETLLLVHVGLHKTGSTWLQKVLFVDDGFETPWGQQAALPVELLAFDDGLAFDPEGTREKLVANRETFGGVPVMSHESLSSRPNRGVYFADKVAQRLKALFPKAKILLIIREQHSIVYSMYQQHVRDGGRCTLTDYIGSDDQPEGFVPPCQLSFFDYTELRKTYLQYFDEDSVLMLPLELLGKNAQEFSDRICTFAGAPLRKVPVSKRVNEAISPPAVAFLRATNCIFRVRDRPPSRWSGYQLSRRVAVRLSKIAPGKKRKAAWEAQIAARIGNRYENSNRALADAIGLDLGAMGYF